MKVRALPRVLIPALLLILLSSGTSQAVDDVESLLAKPVTPGSLALLLPHANHVNVHQRWIQALTHENRQVRATAARLLHVVGNRTAVPALTRALEIETERASSLELGEALLRLAPTAGEALVLDAARRFDSGLFVVSLARARGAGAFDHLERIQALRLDKYTWSEVLPRLIDGRQEALERAVTLALRAEDTDLWEAALELAQKERHLSIDARHLASAATSPIPVVRELAWWQMAAHAVEREPLPDVEALRLSSDVAGSTPEMAFGRELLTRALKGPKTEHPMVVDRERSRPPDYALPSHARSLLQGPLHGLLTRSERRVFERQRSGPPNEPKKQQLPERRVESTVMRTVEELPPGYTASVLAETGCDKRTDQAIAVLTRRRSTSDAPPEIQFATSELSEACTRAARLILTAALVPERTSAVGGVELLILPMHDTFLECLSLDHTGSSVGVVTAQSGGIDPPRKIRHVAPTYPLKAQSGGRQGTVIIEATISPHGCISRANVSQSVATDFDLEAVKSVTGWTFTPTLLEGKPVPVIMTVTVQFTLQ